MAQNSRRDAFSCKSATELTLLSRIIHEIETIILMGSFLPRSAVRFTSLSPCT